ncbi:hypothetical protein SJA_C1-13040 [Sphingobium indicum UT26S]|uniref:Uncharacterized protein n=1 Tax=Sphingobium indicum (strain DSM 16413 / CCM 7287 / MTCC 6362 / UT26 / NBRC 101211 / UT26S) TaxID=452662 RepID=D4Z0K6_SPHIU|nr:hypothetical protein SJA_C1-13040 [Sphingobium indicum UT26S]
MLWPFGHGWFPMGRRGLWVMEARIAGLNDFGWRAEVSLFVTPGLTRGPAFFLSPRPAQGSGTPDQVRGDGGAMTATGQSKNIPPPARGRGNVR